MEKIVLKNIFICIGIGVLFCLSFMGKMSEAADGTVRVAYFDLGSYYKTNPDGSIKSYDAAYLDMISQYTGLDFEYVNCGTWDKALQMLEKNEIDLVGTMQWTLEREKKYSICDASYGYTVAELASLGDSNYIYEDYEGIDGATVGYIEGYVIGDKVNAYMKEHNISLDVKPYKTQNELDSALENGEIDLIAANAHAIHDDWKVVEKFNYAPFYFASRKEDIELTDEISQAVIKINVHQPDFEDDLIKEYFPVMVKSPYNKAEMDCIGKDKTYTIYFDDETKPLVWHEEKTGKMKGVLVDICNELETTTGLKFKYKPSKELGDKVRSTDVSYRTLYEEMGKDTSNETGVTESILDQNFELYHRIGEKYERNGTYTIAVVRNRDGLYDYMEEQYPNCEIKIYDTPKQCIERLADKEVDLAFLNYHVVENIMVTESLSDIAAVPVADKILGIALEFHGEDAQVLSDIIDKGIKLVDADTVNEAMLQYAMNVTPRMTFSYLLKHHITLVIIGFLIIILVLTVCGILIIYARVMKRERNRMKEINRERTDFFARMSHDMRTPMNGILGMLELTEQSDNIDEIKENNKKAMSAGNYMLSLINDTLDLQRLESNKLKMESKLVSVKDFIDNIEEMMRPSALHKHIRFQVNNINVKTEYYFKIDPMRVKQIFVNILSNAIKFTPENGVIVTNIENVSMNDEVASVKVTISDSGIGMSKEFMENNLFKPYSQEFNKVTNRYAGSGLGLAIVKNLVELMGGSIEVESEVGEGTTFFVQLDFPYVRDEIAKVDMQSTNERIAECQEILKGKKILICEDYPLNAEIARRLLEKAGCVVWVVGDGQQGVDCVNESELNSIDAILMDIRMPVMDGLEAARAIRSLNRADAKNIPIIAMTANAYDSDRENSVQAGMNAHLAKPIDKNELYSTLSECITNKIQ